MNEDSFHLGVKALIRNQEGKILLLKVNKEILKNYSGETYWDIPGGRIHKGANVEDTLKREVEEETGITSIKSVTPFTMVLSNNIRIPTSSGDVGLILAIYICNIETIHTISLSEEHTEYGWFDLKNAAELLQVKYPKEFTNKLSQ
jgi:8-oxo-dGTP diphosphatase